MQIAVAEEHEARQLAERNLAEARCAVLPVSAAEELTMQVLKHTVATCGIATRSCHVAGGNCGQLARHQLQHAHTLSLLDVLRDISETF
jgi:hypothetical protein